MAILISLLIISLIAIVICAFLVQETDGQSLLVALPFILISWLLLENKTTNIADPVEIPLSELSIMMDDEVAIIRYNGENTTYDNVSEYNAIRDSTFSLMRIQEFDIFGEDNGSTYELQLND